MESIKRCQKDFTCDSRSRLIGLYPYVIQHEAAERLFTHDGRVLQASN